MQKNRSRQEKAVLEVTLQGLGSAIRLSFILMACFPFLDYGTFFARRAMSILRPRHRVAGLGA